MKYGQIVKSTNAVIAEYNFRLTIRQIYYRLVSPPYQLFPNVMKSYKSLVQLLTKARERGDVDWTKIEDRRRSTSGGESGYANPQEFVNGWMDAMNKLDEYYDRKRWATQPKYIEAWVEKEALASLFERASSEWRVVVFPTVGYSSLTMFMEAVVRFSKIDKKIAILDFRDHDPSGIDMTRDVQNRLRKYGSFVTIKRIALTIDQVKELNLASNPTKIADTRTPRYVDMYGDQCWELDAYPPDKLSELVNSSVKDEIDMKKWNASIKLEKREKKQMHDILEGNEEVEKLRKDLLDAFEKDK